MGTTTYDHFLRRTLTTTKTYKKVFAKVNVIQKKWKENNSALFVVWLKPLCINHQAPIVIHIGGTRTETTRGSVEYAKRAHICYDRVHVFPRKRTASGSRWETYFILCLKKYEKNYNPWNDSMVRLSLSEPVDNRPACRPTFLQFYSILQALLPCSAYVRATAAAINFLHFAYSISPRLWLSFALVKACSNHFRKSGLLRKFKRNCGLCTIFFFEISGLLKGTSDQISETPLGSSTALLHGLPWQSVKSNHICCMLTCRPRSVPR